MRLLKEEVYRLEKVARQRLKYVWFFSVLNTLPNRTLCASFRYFLHEGNSEVSVCEHVVHKSVNSHNFSTVDPASK